MQCLVHPIPAPVPCEHAAGTVPAVGRRCEAEDQQLRAIIAESRHRTTPVGPVVKLPSLDRCDGLAMRDQTLAQPAGHETAIEDIDPFQEAPLIICPVAG